MKEPLMTGLALAVSAVLASAERGVYFKGIDYELTGVERTRVYPTDLVQEGLEAPKAPPKGQEFALVRFKVVVTDASENSAVSDAKLVGSGGVYRCEVIRIWCLSDGCRAAFAFYVPQSVSLDRFELGGIPIGLPEVGRGNQP